ncbi:hypothetical protein CKQ90_36480, partial [Klebsiella pneumoniae]
RDFFTALSKELALPRAIATELPPGVVATARTDGDKRDFFTALSKELALPRAIATELPPGVVATARTD